MRARSSQGAVLPLRREGHFDLRFARSRFRACAAARRFSLRLRGPAIAFPDGIFGVPITTVL
jgi:hypothetical protein